MVWDAMDAKVLADEQHMRVRRSRVVLARLCRRQVRAKLKGFALTTVANAGSPRRARNKPSNHRAGKAGYLGCYLWSTRLAQLFLRGGPGYQPVPGLPCALPISRAKLPQSLGRERAAGRSLMSRRWCRWSCPRRRASSIPEASQLGLRRLWNTGSSGQAGR